MIKRVIFDIDNTLIDWKEEYNQEMNKALDELKIQYTEDDCKKIGEAISDYEKDNYIFNLDKTSEFINKQLGKNYPKELVYKIIEKWGKCTPEKIEPQIEEVLQYLSKKYEMVILTDWYKEPQLNRLKILKIDKYFLEIYSAENFRRKPFPDGFMLAKGSNKPEECVMIGDDFERDIKGAINCGINAIWYTHKNNNVQYQGKIINNLIQLKEIL